MNEKKEEKTIYRRKFSYSHTKFKFLLNNLILGQEKLDENLICIAKILRSVSTIVFNFEEGKIIRSQRTQNEIEEIF